MHTLYSTVTYKACIKTQTNNTRKHTHTHKQTSNTHARTQISNTHKYTNKQTGNTHMQAHTHTHVHPITSKCVLFKTLTFSIHCSRLLDLPSQNYINYIL